MAESVGNTIGLGGAVLTARNILKWPVILLLVGLAIAILYYATPNVKQPKFRWMSLGSAIALVIFLLASLAFAFYVANFNNYDKTYGAIGGVIVSLLWLWIVFRTEFDAETGTGQPMRNRRTSSALHLAAPAKLTAPRTKTAVHLPSRGTRPGTGRAVSDVFSDAYGGWLKPYAGMDLPSRCSGQLR